MPKVSVIIPVYGVEKYIERCAHTLFQQTLDDIEYIFIDDCSPDNSIPVLKRILAEYPNRTNQVVIHRMQKNSGQAKVREWGMKNASGDYIIHCDSDDWIDLNMYEEMYTLAIDSESDIVYCDYIIEGGLNDKKRYYRKVNGLSKDELMERLLTTSSLNSLWSALVRRTLIDKISFPQGNQSEDKTMLIQLVWYADKVIGIDKAFYHYVDNPTSITNAVSPEKIELRASQIFSNVDLILSFLQKENIMHRYKRFLCAYLFNAKSIYFILLSEPKFYSMWKLKYKEFTKYYLFDPYIHWKVKIVTLLKLCKSVKILLFDEK